jgi:hypothetical protein
LTPDTTKVRWRVGHQAAHAQEHGIGGCALDAVDRHSGPDVLAARLAKDEPVAVIALLSGLLHISGCGGGGGSSSPTLPPPPQPHPPPPLVQTGAGDAVLQTSISFVENTAQVTVFEVCNGESFNI